MGKRKLFLGVFRSCICGCSLYYLVENIYQKYLNIFWTSSVNREFRLYTITTTFRRNILSRPSCRISNIFLTSDNSESHCGKVILTANFIRFQNDTITLCAVKCYQTEGHILAVHVVQKHCWYGTVRSESQMDVLFAYIKGDKNYFLN